MRVVRDHDMRRTMALAAVGLLTFLVGCTSDNRSPEARTCDAIWDLPDRDTTGELESDVLKRKLDDWRKVWKHAQDAEPDFREPVRKIVDDLARSVEGRGSTLHAWSENQLAQYELASACIDLPSSGY